MADVDFDTLVCGLEFVLQLIGKHHLRQLTVATRAVLMIILADPIGKCTAFDRETVRAKFSENIIVCPSLCC